MIAVALPKVAHYDPYRRRPPGPRFPSECDVGWIPGPTGWRLTIRACRTWCDSVLAGHRQVPRSALGDTAGLDPQATGLVSVARCRENRPAQCHPERKLVVQLTGTVRRSSTLVMLVATTIAAALLALRLSRAREPTDPDVPAAQTQIQSVFAGVPDASLREYLQAYWGTQWREIETALSPEQTLFLDRRVRQVDIPAWRVVEPVIEVQLRQDLQDRRDELIADLIANDHAESHVAALKRRLGAKLTAENLALIDAIVGRHGAELDQLARIAVDLIVEAHEHNWDSENYRVFPFVEPTHGTPDPSCASRFNFQIKLLRCNWVISYVFESSQFPVLEEVVGRIENIRRAREQEVASYAEQIE